MIDVSVGQCKRAKQCALYEHEGGLIEHYGKLWEYRQAILESNPGSTCHLDVKPGDNGQICFQRLYMCFKGVKDGWIAGCRKVIGLDGCFITHTCKGQLLTAMGRDGNNQMFPIAWAVVDVENKNNWCWFLSLLSDDLNLSNGLGVTVISDAHKVIPIFVLLNALKLTLYINTDYTMFCMQGLIEAVKTWLPQAEHRHCTRHLYANFKRKWNGLEYRRLFWGAASSTIEQNFNNKMNEIKQLDEEAHKYLMDRNPSSWSKAFFQTDSCCASFENGISESFNGKLLGARGKPIITMLEDIRVYIMQRTWCMSQKAAKLDDTITPSVRKLLERLKRSSRKWQVVPSVYQVVEVRKKDQAYGVNLMTRTCHCNLWQLSGVPCIHAVAAFLHFKMEPEVGVSDWYSQSKWYDTYQCSIKPVFGSKFWKPTRNPPPFPPIVKKMPGRPKKNRFKHPTEDLMEHSVSRVGRVITCQNCQGTGHNKTTCTQPKKPKPQKQFKPIKKPKVVVPTKRKNKKAVGETSKAGALRNKKDDEAGTSKAGVGGSASMNTQVINDYLNICFT